MGDRRVKNRTAPQVITANRLIDGDVVYMTAGRDWTPRLQEAYAIGPEEDMDPFLEKARADVAARLVVDAYPFPVTLENGAPEALSAREIIRALGPTIRTDLGKQAEA